MTEMSGSSQAITCSICLKRLRHCRLGKPEPCHHVFCFTCIFEWAKNVNTCPVDRIKFNVIEVFNSLHGKCIEKVHVADQTIDDEPPDFTYCEVCHDHTREHELLLCDGCDKGFHLGCLNPPLSEVPEGDWYCTSCQLIIKAQYHSWSSSDSEALMEWDSSSGSDLDITHRRRPSRVVISESEESESDSDVEEIQTKRIIWNICSVGEQRVLVSDSETSTDSESDTEDIGPKRVEESGTRKMRTRGCASSSSVSTSDQHSNALQLCPPSSSTTSPRRGSYVTWLRQFSNGDSPTDVKDSAPTTRSASKKAQQRCSQTHPSIKPFSVVITPLKSNTQHTPSLPTPPSHSTHTQPSASTVSENTPSLPTTKRKTRRRKRRTRLVLKPAKKKKRTSAKKKKRRISFRSDNAYLPDVVINSTRKSQIGTRSKARTVASYTPQQRTFRAAARESYRHSDLGAGLENARKIIQESGYIIRHSPTRKPINFPTPQSGYLGKPPNVSRMPLREKVKEIKKRTVSDSKKADLRGSYQHTISSTPSRISIAPSAGKGILLDQICQNLDDLNNTRNIIQRDGTIIPLRSESPEQVSIVKSSRSNSQVESECADSQAIEYHYCHNHFSLPHSLTDQYDSSEPELVIDEKANVSNDTNSLPNIQKFFSQTFIHKCPAQPWIKFCTNEEPSSSTDSVNTFIDVTSMTKVQSFVRDELDKYHFAGEISDRQYHRIQERATQKVMKGKNTTLARVKKLVSDYVNLYKLLC